MKQANYNGGLRGSVGGIGRGVGRGVDSLAPPPGCDLFGYLPRMSPRFARLNTGLRTAATPPGCPARSASKWVADCVPSDAALASLPMGTNAASLRCRFALSGLCGVALPFHDVKVRFKFRGY